MNRCAFVSVCACAWALNTGRGRGVEREWVFQSAQLLSHYAAFEACGSPLKSAEAASGQWDCSGSGGGRAVNAFEIPTQNVWEKARLLKKHWGKEKKKLMAECISVANTNNTVHFMKREGECCMFRAEERPVRLGSTCLRVVLRADIGSVSCWEIREKLLADITKTINGNHMSADQSLSYSLRLD